MLENRHKLCHFHFHDLRGSRDHQPLGTGEIDLSGYLRLAAERGARAVAETKTVEGLRRSVDWLRGVGALA